MDLATSTHALLRVGEQEDLYYTDPANCKKQSIPVEYNTRFRQDFSNKSSGTSVFIIPPGNGLRHIIVVIGYNKASINTNTGGAVLPRGWGYNAISQISFRIGGSSQYFLQGDQLLARNLRLCRTQSQRDAILQLGGAECKVAADFAVDQYAYIPISVFAGPSADGISLPLPADLLSQQVQITAQLNPSAAFWITNTNAGGLVANLPNAFDTAFFQVEQLVMSDRAMSLASRVDLDTHSYNMAAVPFDQQTLTIPLAANTAVGATTGVQQQVTLTGFRSGEVTKVQMWLTKDSDALNPGKWYVPASVTALYAGVIFAQYEAGSSRLWNLLDGTAPAAVNQSVLSLAGGGGGAMTSAPALSEWVELPFSQPTGRDFEADVLVHGKQILNGLVNLQITPPDQAAYTLHVVYVYNSTLTFSRGSCDFVF